MALTLDQINQVTIANVRLWLKQQAINYGIAIPPDWNPSDEQIVEMARELAKLYGMEETE